MGIFWEDEAWNEYLGWQELDKKTLRKINKLIKDIQRTPFEGTGIHTTILSCKGHYNNK